MMSVMEFGPKIEMLIDRKGWTVAELARRTNISKTTIGHWVEGKRKPFSDFLLRVADAFGVDPNFLTDDELDEPPPVGLTEDERSLLKVVHKHGLTADEAMDAVIAWTKSRQAGGPSVLSAKRVEPASSAGTTAVRPTKEISRPPPPAKRKRG